LGELLKFFLVNKTIANDKKNGEEVETGLKLAVFFCNVELLGTKLILLWIISENRFLRILLQQIFPFDCGMNHPLWIISPFLIASLPRLLMQDTLCMIMS